MAASEAKHLAAEDTKVSVGTFSPRIARSDMIAAW